MRILVIGNSHATNIFSNLLCENKKNLVFSTFKESSANFVDITGASPVASRSFEEEKLHFSSPHSLDISFLDVSELKEFALANEIDLTVLTDFECIDTNFVEVFQGAGLSIFAPDESAKRICSQKDFAKKFMYRNKIKTPRFQIFDKIQLALEYARAAKYPIVIKPDVHSPLFGTTICETFPQAQKTIDDFAQFGVKNLVIENYVSGREFSTYVITDGYNSFLLDFVATKLNRYATLGANFIDSDKIMNSVINPTIEALAKNGNHYVGILGMDFIMDNSGEIYALEYNPFFESLDVELFTKCIDMNWEKLFESAVLGTLKDEFLQPKNKKNCVSMITDDGKIECAQGRTTNEAIENLEVSGWKF